MWLKSLFKVLLRPGACAQFRGQPPLPAQMSTRAASACAASRKTRPAGSGHAQCAHGNVSGPSALTHVVEERAALFVRGEVNVEIATSQLPRIVRLSQTEAEDQ